MSRTAATRRASYASKTEQHPCLDFPGGSRKAPDTPAEAGAPTSPSIFSTPSGEPKRMNTPNTSYPSRSSSAAATELSTPPLMAQTTFFPDGLFKRTSRVNCRGEACLALFFTGMKRGRDKSRRYSLANLSAGLRLTILCCASYPLQSCAVGIVTSDRAEFKFR